VFRIFRSSLPPTLLVAGLCVSLGSPANGQPQPPAAPPGYPAPPPGYAPPPVTQPTQQSGVVARPTAPPASYAPPGVNVNQYAPSYAPYAGVPYGDPWGNPTGGGLTGAANAINAQGEFEKQFQEARLMNQDVERSKLDTRRAKIEQWQWERNNLPTLEDNRRRDQYEQLRRSVNDPPPAEIWDGSALNRILTAIQQAQPPGSPGPMIPLNPSLMTQLNLTAGASSTGPGLLKNGPKLRWPLALQDDAFDGYRQGIDTLMKAAYDQVLAGDVDGKVLRQLYQQLDQFEASLKSKIEEMTPTQNVQGKRYLRELRSTVKVLEQPEAHDMFAAARTGPPRTVGDLVQGMTAKGQKFGPALAGSEPAYTSLHSSLVAYYTSLTQPSLRTAAAP
jgi:hypothetical protein